MSKYFDEMCKQCDEWIRPYGCTNRNCPIYIDYELGRAEIAGDEEHDRRMDTIMEKELT